MSAGCIVDTQHGHLAPCIPGTNKLIAKQGQVHATLQHQPFLASVIDMVMMLSASQKASWPTSSLVIPSSGRHVPAQQKSGQFVYTPPPPRPPPPIPPHHKHKHKPPGEARPCSLCNLGGWDVSFTDSFFCEFSHAYLNLLMDSPKTKWESQLFPSFRGQGKTFRVTVPCICLCLGEVLC